MIIRDLLLASTSIPHAFAMADYPFWTFEVHQQQITLGLVLLILGTFAVLTPIMIVCTIIGAAWKATKEGVYIAAVAYVTGWVLKKTNLPLPKSLDKE